MKVSFFLEKWPITLNEHSFWSNEGDSLPNLKIFWCFQGVEISNTGLQWLKLREKISLRSSRLQVFLGKDILKIWSKFTGDHPCRSAISIKLQSNFIEMVLRHGWSPVNLLHIFTVDACFWFIEEMKVIVSETRRSRDIKIPLCLSAPSRKSLI